MRRIAVIGIGLLVILPTAVAASRCCSNVYSFALFSFQSGRDQFSGSVNPSVAQGHCEQRRRIVIKRVGTKEVVAKTRSRNSGRYMVHTDETDENGPWFAHVKPVERDRALCRGTTSLPIPLDPPPG